MPAMSRASLDQRRERVRVNFLGDLSSASSFDGLKSSGCAPADVGTGTGGAFAGAILEFDGSGEAATTGGVAPVATPVSRPRIFGCTGGDFANFGGPKPAARKSSTILPKALADKELQQMVFCVVKKYGHTSGMFYIKGLFPHAPLVKRVRRQRRGRRWRRRQFAEAEDQRTLPQ
jgi:hypothetical protein